MAAVNQIGQIAVSVDDVDAAEQFYTEVVGLRKLFRFGSLLFFDCAGVRLLVEQSAKSPFEPCSSVIYFRTPDLTVAYPDLKARGAVFVDEPHLIAPMQDHDLWMAFFKDPAGNLMALMQEAPKGHKVWDSQST